MLKKCKVVILPTNQKVTNIKESRNKLTILTKEGLFLSNLYILSDDQIKEGDWFIACGLTEDKTIIPEYSLLYQCKGFDGQDLLLEKGCYRYNYPDTQLKKVIATTDPTLNLPSPSKSFIEKYCELGGIDEVMVAWEELPGEWLTELDHCPYSEAISRPVISNSNTITIKKIKETWTREEVVELCTKAFMKGGDRTTYFEDFERWINENL